MTSNLAASLYLISGVLFILALRGLSSPETSRQGNFFGILGMALAITVTFLFVDILFSGFIFIICALAIGGLIGAIIAASSLSSDDSFELYNIFGLVAIILASINIFGGFLVTQRMLKMYKKKKKVKIK